MTRPEITSKRDLRFNNWIREKLPDSSTGFLVSDIDFVLCDVKTRRVLLLEIKTRSTPMQTWQHQLLQDISRWIRHGIDDGWVYRGYHFIVFENTWFDDGDVWLNGFKITEEELARELSI